MNKIIILFLVVFINAGEIELFEKLFTQIFHKKTIKIYTNKFKNFNSTILKKVNKCENADIVLGSNKCNKPKFLLTYDNFKEDKDAIGAFYWRKGRPQIRLRRNVFLKYHLFFSKDFEDYLE